MTLFPSWVTDPRKVSATDATSIDQGNFNALMNFTNTLVQRVPPTYYDVSTEQGRQRMIGMRLRLADGSRFPFDHISSHLCDDKVLVFVVPHNKSDAVILEDDPNLFPSDTLITQLRLLT